MASGLVLQCARCGILSCKLKPGEKKPPAFCPMSKDKQLLDDVRSVYLKEAEIRRFAVSAARTEAAGYGKDTRVEEIIAYGRRIGARHLGIACCVGTQHEARLAQEIFEANGFRVSSVACKVGSIPKEELGLTDEEKVRPGTFEALCNPIAQARLLAGAGTQLNVLIGLCVGHDSLFFRYSEAPVTVLMVKDRVTGHNPAAALYTSQSYYRRLRNPRGASAAHEERQTKQGGK
jgi:uncharacterized metal-binding protein